MCGACLGTAGTVAFPCQIDFWAGRQPLASGFSSPGSRHPQGLPEELLSKYLPRRVCVTTYVCLHVCIFVFVHVCTCPCACIGVCVYVHARTLYVHMCVCACVCAVPLCSLALRVLPFMAHSPEVTHPSSLPPYLNCARQHLTEKAQPCSSNLG